MGAFSLIVVINLLNRSELDMDSEVQVRKMEVDYSGTVEKLIPECLTQAKDGDVSGAVEKLLTMEKQTRLASDVFSTEKILVTIVRILYDAQQFDNLLEQIVALSKKRSQLRQAVTKMVQESCKFVEELNDESIKFKLIDTLRSVCEGKIYVENERARLTKILADHKEANGLLEEAVKLMIELQVETYNTMDRREKVNFILEQMRFCLDNNDFIRTQIISKKISTRYFEDEATHDLKLRFYRLMIRLDKHEGSYLDICKHFHAIYETPVVKANESDKFMALKSVVLFICLAEYGNEQSDFMNRIALDKNLKEEPMKLYSDLLKLFLTSELISWSALEANFTNELRTGSKSNPPPEVFTGDEGEKAWKCLKERVVEHNIRVMTKYYTRVKLERMSVLLDLPSEEVESCISRLVFKEMIYARIDGLTNIVSFKKPRDAAKVLDDWSVSINGLMSLMSHASHLIDKEFMVHKYANAPKGTAR